MQIQIDSKGVTQGEYFDTLKREVELLKECQNLSGLVKKVGKWNIVNKPVKPVEFEKKFQQLVRADFSEKKEEPNLEEVGKVA